MWYIFLHWLKRLWYLLFFRQSTHRNPAKKISALPKSGFRQPKPAWMQREVILLAAHMPGAGCRRIAHTFNRAYQHKGVSISKSTVYVWLRAHAYEIEVLRRRLKHRRPYSIGKNQLWQLDLTKLTHLDAPVFGAIDSGTRACLLLQQIRSKASIQLLRMLLNVIESYGTPKAIRTDNEACFTSRLFRFGLWLLAIKHQTTKIAHPWQNGKIERLFGTLKQHAKGLTLKPKDLETFRRWYNHIRPHDYLDGRTPAECWHHRSPKRGGRQAFVSEWGGALTGIYLEPG